MFKKVLKESLGILVKNIVKIIMVAAMIAAIALICVVMPLYVFESKLIYNILSIFVMPLVICGLSTFIASLPRGRNTLNDAFLLFTDRYVRNITVMVFAFSLMFMGPIVYAFKDIVNEILQIPLICAASCVSCIFMFKYRYLHLVLAENPNLSVMQVFEKNKEICKGNNIKRVLMSLLVTIIPAVITAVIYNKFYDAVNPVYIVAVGSSITYIIKEVFDMCLYRELCGDIYIKLPSSKPVESAKSITKDYKSQAPVFEGFDYDNIR
ncbi:MAG: hypothetical protein RSB51_05025 [Clostridia bacterium]